MATMKVEDSLSGLDVDVELPPAPGRAAAAASRPVALSDEDKAVLDLLATASAQATLQTAVDAIKTAVELLDNAVSGATLTVSGTVTADAGSGSVAAGTAGTPSANVLSVQGIASMTALSVSGTAINTQAYETVAASQTAQALGATGATGDYLGHIIIQPSTTAPGVVTVIDNATTVYPYPGGTVDAALAPIIVPINAVSVSGAWKITTGANVSVVAVGTFT